VWGLAKQNKGLRAAIVERSETTKKRPTEMSRLLFCDTLDCGYF